MSLEKRNIAVVITGLQDQPYRMLQHINMVPGLIPDNYLFDNIEECVKWLGEEFRRSEKGEEVFFEELGDEVSFRGENKTPLKYRM